MTKKYLFSRQRFARHMDSKIEQNFDKVIRSPFTDYFTHNTEELSNDCIQSIKESMCATVCENIDLLVREITLEKEEEEQKPAKKERKKKQSPVPKVVVEEHQEEEEEEVVVETVSKKKSPKAKKKKSTSDE
jgi:replication initiation and membrane attachment protein DnaB